MLNGSLGDLLHDNKGSVLDLPMRYKIALEAAEGLSYLHHDCVSSIVHRDVKSNNILMDEKFGAKVADFGVAKAVENGPKSMSVIASSCGYIALEYAYTLRVNEKSDIYSFGVVILELVIGKLPIDPEYNEKDLVKWVCRDIEGTKHWFTLCQLSPNQSSVNEGGGEDAARSSTIEQGQAGKLAMWCAGKLVTFFVLYAGQQVV
ncbi:hypothetical protein ZIOFF_015520 [Zingiber officinale]|uniref:non-specific serine/threonine protein kinase n=1 Tax=Zingiber officinale TaxID=94328 RepID=A0A8J5I0F8_ZINOF|nr:hypothetical protein ZIOFF_015520 [Zingiber officinale]